jgi:RHS repeat-associated protein
LSPVALFLRKNIKIFHSDNNPTLPMTTTISAYQIHCSFSGKEKDSETGYYYFGARYYNPDLSLWLSVDPMSDKYPSLSPYNYCAWNPMKLVDPDGSETIDNDDIVIKGSNNSSLTIKTSVVDITLHTKQDLRGNHVIDASSKQVVIGYEVGGDATGSAVFQSSGSVYKQSVMFLSGDYSGYWYD